MLYVVIVLSIVLGSSLGYYGPISARHMVIEGVSAHFVILFADRGWSTAAALHRAVRMWREKAQVT